MNFVENITGKKTHLDKRTFRLTPYSPVFVGSGEKWTKGLDFDCTNNQTMLFDLHKLFKDQISDVGTLEHAIRHQSLGKYITRNNLDTKAYIKQVINGTTEGSELSEPIKDGFGNPIIPGSSLKGSIRSALFAHLFEKAAFSAKDYKSILSGRKVNARKLEEKLLTTYRRNKKGSSPNYDLGRALRVSDVSFDLSNLEIFNTAIVNETHSGFKWKKLGRGNKSNTHDLSQATKVSVAAISFSEDILKEPEFNISIDNNVLKDIGWKENFDFKTVASACNRLSKRLIDADIQYLKAAKAKDQMPQLNVVEEDLSMIHEDIDACQNEVDHNNGISWIQRVGWGTGWLSKTGAHSYLNIPKKDNQHYQDILRNIAGFLFKQSGNFIFPKTRNIVLDPDGNPSTTMGWVLVEMV